MAAVDRSPKPILWVGTSLRDLRSFPKRAREDAGTTLRAIQNHETPKNCESIAGSVGPGAMEVKIEIGDAYRVFYVAKFDEAIYVLHCFNKKSKSGIATPRRDLDLAKQRYREVVAKHNREVAIAKKSTRGQTQDRNTRKGRTK